MSRGSYSMGAQMVIAFVASGLYELWFAWDAAPLAQTEASERAVGSPAVGLL
jgi:hypothetical protein